MGERLRSDRGSLSQRGTAIMAGCALVVCGAAFAGKKAWDSMPHEQSSPNRSAITARQIKLVPEAIDCRSLAVYDTSGSTVRTHYKIAGKELGFTGYGATMNQGRVVKEACVNGEGVTVTNGKVDGKAVKRVAIKVSDIVYDTHTNSGNTEVMQTDPPVTKVLDGLVDIGSGTAELSCKLASNLPFNPIPASACVKVNAVANWNEGNQAELRSALTTRVENFVQEGCGKSGWVDERKAFADGYKMLAVKQGALPDMVRVTFVDDQGKPTNQMPDFKHSALDGLYKDGTLDRQLAGSPELEFSSMTCHKSSSYKPLF